MFEEKLSAQFYPQHSIPQADRVIFNPPATIVYWADSTKTIVRCSRDEFSEEVGFAMACGRKLCQ